MLLQRMASNTRRLGGLLLLAGLASAGCNELAGIEAPTHRGGGGAGGGGGGSGPACGDPKAEVDKLDLLLAIDNSRGMADKQQILALALPDLVKQIVNPPCIDPATGVAQAFPAGPYDPCPEGTEREFVPPRDMHIGIVSSSLGSHGADACQISGLSSPSNDDAGHLLARADPDGTVAVESYQGLGFLAWDPLQALEPPGEADIDEDSLDDTNGTAIVPSLTDMVTGVGQVGCGYESQLESWYRFLVDPEPRASLALDPAGNVVLSGVDDVLLAQRKAFLRPDSMLVIVMFSDENDCSVREEGQMYLALQLQNPDKSIFHLPKARAECALAPNDPCCFPCGQTGPVGEDGAPVCAMDPACVDGNGAVALHDNLSDHIHMRCFDQKRRFGVDFMYPVDRYVTGLTSCTVPDRSGQLVPNPIFSDLDPTDSISTIRDPSLVVLAGIVGVPWQDVARTRADGVPDLVIGLDAEGKPRGGLKTAAEMLEPLPGLGYDTWSLVLGDPEAYPAPAALPRDPLMIESIDPRTGVSPVIGAPLTPSTEPLANSVNGHEYSIPQRDDLQYTCIFPLPGGAERDCTSNEYEVCECKNAANDSPLCAVNPGTGNPTTQVRARANPGIRQLQVLRGVGPQGVVASICAAQLESPDGVDFGYRPAVRAIVDKWKARRE